MPVTCQTITVLKPAHITATNMTIDHIDCDEPCDSTITITWTNTGSRTATIIPGIVVNGTRTAGTSMTLAKDQTSIQTFHVTGLTEGTYTVCPDPN